ncbi:hypothetical protein EOPP23_09145 [Endozoicomonas sp. OPT23]|uniref:hypothetical protein n=1 Tax=Endozoicomonas sp. OPT23 TaxID=2072845 RepID=UPI00129BC1E8|nr:hypothetical protein [Endozoicomonas sp. OPT23]MRI33147.1 hypothetical protein [Endozoicomonas sp. OPT23]
MKPSLKENRYDRHDGYKELSSRTKLKDIPLYCLLHGTETALRLIELDVSTLQAGFEKISYSLSQYEGETRTLCKALKLGKYNPSRLLIFKKKLTADLLNTEGQMIINPEHSDRGQLQATAQHLGFLLSLIEACKV